MKILSEGPYLKSFIRRVLCLHRERFCSFRVSVIRLPVATYFFSSRLCDDGTKAVKEMMNTNETAKKTASAKKKKQQETHAERQVRIQAEAVAFAFSDVPAKEVRRRQTGAPPVLPYWKNPNYYHPTPPPAKNPNYYFICPTPPPAPPPETGAPPVLMFRKNPNYYRCTPPPAPPPDDGTHTKRAKYELTMSDDKKETYEERPARVLPSRLLENAYLNGFFTNEERQAGGIVKATIPYTALSSAVQAQQHYYEIWEIDDGDEMKINDHQKEEKWQNPMTFTFEKYMKDFNHIKPKPKPEDDEDIVAMLVESDPIKRVEAILNKEYHTVTFASPNNNQVYLQADRKTEITTEFWNKISDGAMCVLFPAYNWDGCINVGDYYPHDYKNEGVPDNLLDGICKHRLVPLQSIKKKLGGNAKKAVWMAPVYNLAWMAGHVGAHKSKPLLKSKNRVVAVLLFPGDPWLKLLTLFWALGAYVRAIHPAQAFERIPVQSSNTIEFDINAIPYKFKHLPRHYDMVEVMTPKEKLESCRKYYAENCDRILARRKQEELEASFAKFSQKKVFRESLQCGCGEQYERYTDYLKHINQCKYRHFGMRKAKVTTLETPGISKLYEIKEKRGVKKFNRLFGHLSITSPVWQSAHRLLFQELRHERLDQLEKELVLLNFTPISNQDLQSNFRISVIKNEMIEIQDELRRWHHYQH